MLSLKNNNSILCAAEILKVQKQHLQMSAGIYKEEIIVCYESSVEDRVPHKINFTSDTNCRCEVFPKSPSCLIVFWKDSQNSPKAYTHVCGLL